MQNSSDSIMNAIFKAIYCRRIETLLWGYQSDRLTAEERRRVSQHLAECPTCRIAVTELANTVTLVAAFRENASVEPVSGWQTLEARLLAQEQNKMGSLTFPLRMRGLSLAGGLAALALLCGIVWRGAPTLKYVRSNSGTTILTQKPDRLSSATTAKPFESYAPTKKAPADLPAVVPNNTLKQELASTGQILSPYTIHEHNMGRQNRREPERFTLRTIAVKKARSEVGTNRDVKLLGESNSAAKSATEKTIAKTKVLLLGVVVAARSNVPKQDFVMPAIRTAADESVPKAYVMDTISNPSDKSAANVSNAGYFGSNGEKRTW